MGKVVPIRPEDVTVRKADILPGEVIEAFNELIAKAWDGKEAVVMQNDVVAAIRTKMSGRATGEFQLDSAWLDVEPIYEMAGWRVKYDKPGYDEAYEPSYVFTKSRRKVTR